MNKTSSNKIKVVAIVGATASGKTAYSIELARQIGGEIISADSRLVYKGFDIGTAKPTLEERQGIPHHMIDIVEPEFDYSAGLYQQQAKEKIYEISSRGKIPIMVGGTGLYFNVLLNNYEMPHIEPNWDLRHKLENYSNLQLFDMLLDLNGEVPDIIDIKDRKKIIRAIEIVKTSGKRLDEVRGFGENEFEVEWLGRNFERKVLYERINKRVDLMVEQGLIEETEKLLQKHGRIPNLVDTIGYQEIISYLDGKMTLGQAVDLLKQNTRRYAKRQLTWFRRNKEIKWNIHPKIEKK